MTTTKNAENLRQYKTRFSFILEQILALVFIANLVGEIKNF